LSDADLGAARRYNGVSAPVSIDIASLVPNAKIAVSPWKGPPELKSRTIGRARTFLKRHHTA
jgi:hypothetical protein